MEKTAVDELREAALRRVHQTSLHSMAEQVGMPEEGLHEYLASAAEKPPIEPQLAALAVASERLRSARAG